MMDQLTGLYNRRGWDQLLAAEENRCRTFGTPASVLSIDLDGLKRVNDSGGHAKGDELICRAARAIQAAVRSQDVVARVGGDEFVVLGVGCNLAGGERLRERIGENLAKVAVDASLGLATRRPTEGLLAAVETADREMYACKRGRRVAVCS
jgi:diguanylate cyclase (GGDEF)-like protein